MPWMEKRRMFTRARGKKKAARVVMYWAVRRTSRASCSSPGSRKSMAHFGANRSIPPRAISA